MAKMMCYAIDFSSTVTVTHIILVTAIAKKLAQLYFLPDDETENIVQASALHDIGKLIVPVNILEKPGKLTEAEFQIMKYHAATGYDILSTLGLEHLRDIGSLHHEKLDGSGYPFGLKGDQIPFAARLVTVVDILAALLARRSYKEAMDKDTICSILNEMVDQNQIDANIVAKVIENFDEIVDHAKVEADPILFLYESLNDEYEKELEGILTLVK